MKSCGGLWQVVGSVWEGCGEVVGSWEGCGEVVGSCGDAVGSYLNVSF